jgi:hypothetical protein
MAFVGQASLEHLIRLAIETAQLYQFQTTRSKALIVFLMFILGHSCCKDALYPWIARTLTGTVITDPADRAKRLERKSLMWFDFVLERRTRKGE